MEERENYEGGGVVGGTKSKFLVIMMVDIVGYTRITSGLRRETIGHLHDVFDELVLSTVEKAGGQVIKKIGDSFMSVFESATDSLYCAMELQEKFKAGNEKEKTKVPIRIKIAINAGEVVIRSGDVYGDAVNLAARMEKIVKPDQIYFTQAVFLAMNKNEIPFKYIGTKTFKGFEYSIRIFRVRGEYENILRKREIFGDLIGGFVWILIFGVAGFLVYYKWDEIVAWAIYGFERVAGFLDRMVREIIG